MSIGSEYGVEEMLPYLLLAFLQSLHHPARHLLAVVSWLASGFLQKTCLYEDIVSALPVLVLSS